MKTYKLKDRGQVQAQQFIVDQDRGSWPPYTEKHRWKAATHEVRLNDSLPFVYADIEDKDYVVMQASGWRRVVRSMEFESLYVEVE